MKVAMKNTFIKPFLMVEKFYLIVGEGKPVEYSFEKSLK